MMSLIVSPIDNGFLRFLKEKSAYFILYKKNCSQFLKQGLFQQGGGNGMGRIGERAFLREGTHHFWQNPIGFAAFFLRIG